MLKALHTASTGMKVQQTQLDVIANNLANANTTAFKRSQVDFQDLLYYALERPGAPTSTTTNLPTGLEVGSGARAVSTSKIMSQGGLEETRRPLDMAIQGAGFFQITMPDGSTAYTRDGSFRPSSTGQIVNAQGFPLFPAITISPTAISIAVGRDGSINVTEAATPNQTTSVGTVTIALFPNPPGLTSEGQNLYKETASSGTATAVQPGQSGGGVLVGQSLERSNVEVVTELVNLITAQRAYEVNSKAIRSADEMLSMANNVSR
jgi:flagellar basal-body rod protein FlgG